MFNTFQNNSKFAAYVFFVMIAFIISGCGATMPLTRKDSQVNITKDSIGIMSVKLSNKITPNCEPRVIYFKVSEGDTGSEEKYHVDAWGHNEVYNGVKGEFNEYLLSFQLSPGHYKIGEMKGFCEVFLVHGMFTFPINAEFELYPNSITYIGHVEMVNRERKDGEPRAGSIFPLIDQAASGFSGGTFDISIYDRYPDDINIIKDRYPSIGGYEVKSNIAKMSEPKSDN